MATEVRAPGSRRLRWPLRVLTAGALVTDVIVHIQLAGRYDLNAEGGLSQGDLFRIEAGMAALAAGLILLIANRITWVFALIVAAGALAAVLMSRYVDVGQLGPLPDMYEPSWYPQKVITTLAEAVGTVTAMTGLIYGPRPQTSSW